MMEKFMEFDPAPAELLTARQCSVKEYCRIQRSRIITNRVRTAVLMGIPVKTSGKLSKTRLLANRSSLNPRKIFKGRLALSLQERRRSS